jgi:hypothetical protein
LQIAATSLKQFEIAGYSSTPLARKLVIKAAATVVVVNGPANRQKLLGQAARLRVFRAVALPPGFVDVKVCAVDETWSGLKLMVRRTNRKLPRTDEIAIP